MGRVFGVIFIILIGLFAWSQVGGESVTVPEDGDPLDGVGKAVKNAPDSAADGIANLPPGFWEKGVPIIICCVIGGIIVARLPKGFWILALVVVALGAFASKGQG